MATTVHAHGTCYVRRSHEGGYLSSKSFFCWHCTAWRDDMAEVYLVAGGISGRPTGESWVQNLQELLAALSARATAAGA